MKKLLTLLIILLCTFSGFGQTDSKLDYSRVNTVTKVGDTLVVKLQYFEGTDANNTATAPTLYQFDFQYNNKLLNKIKTTWQPSSTSAQKAINSWNGYKFAIHDTKDQTDFDGQYLSWLAGDASYTTNADWTVERVTYQDVTALENGQEFVKYEFIIKDKANSNYTDYSNILNANFANYKLSDGTQLGVTGNSTLANLGSIQGGDAGNVTINLSSNVITNNIGDGTDYSYYIYAKGDNQAVLADGTFDASGQATVTGLENDVEYDIYVTINDAKEYLDEAVTVSDLALVFAEAIGAGSSPNGISTTFDYYLQSVLANVVGDPISNGGDINFDDSYEILAYLQGVTSPKTSYITKTGGAYNISGIKETFGDVVNDIATWSPTFKPTDSNKSFNVVHVLNGDVNFSHGFQPTSTNADIPTTAKAFGINQSRYVPEVSNLDLASQIVDGQVEFSINIDTTDMIGAQFNIEYDTTKLALENVIFDTGNDMTNFSNLKEAEGKVNIGSFDQNFQYTIKSGTPYKLVFTPLQQLDNVLGLITFKVTEGVKADGTQVKFQLQ